MSATLTATGTTTSRPSTPTQQIAHGPPQAQPTPPHLRDLWNGIDQEPEVDAPARSEASGARVRPETPTVRVGVAVNVNLGVRRGRPGDRLPLPNQPSRLGPDQPLLPTPPQLPLVLVQGPLLPTPQFIPQFVPQFVPEQPLRVRISLPHEMRLPVGPYGAMVPVTHEMTPTSMVEPSPFNGKAWFVGYPHIDPQGGLSNFIDLGQPSSALVIERGIVIRGCGMRVSPLHSLWLINALTMGPSARMYDFAQAPGRTMTVVFDTPEQRQAFLPFNRRICSDATGFWMAASPNQGENLRKITNGRDNFLGYPWSFTLPIARATRAPGSGAL